METLIVVLLAALVVGVFLLAFRISRTPAPVLPAPDTSQSATVDVVAIVEAVKVAIDVGAISTGVQGAVEAKIHDAAATVLARAGDEARKQADERLAAQRQTLESETRSLLQPFEQQMASLKTEVEKLHSLNAEKFGSVDEAVKGLAVQTSALRNVVFERISSQTSKGEWQRRM